MICLVVSVIQPLSEVTVSVMVFIPAELYFVLYGLLNEPPAPSVQLTVYVPLDMVDASVNTVVSQKQVLLKLKSGTTKG